MIDFILHHSRNDARRKKRQLVADSELYLLEFPGGSQKPVTSA